MFSTVSVGGLSSCGVCAFSRGGGGVGLCPRMATRVANEGGCLRGYKRSICCKGVKKHVCIIFMLRNIVQSTLDNWNP